MGTEQMAKKHSGQMGIETNRELGANKLLEKIKIWGEWAPREMGTRANGHLRKMDIWGKGVVLRQVLDVD